MLPSIRKRPISFQQYKPFMDDDLYKEVKTLFKDLGKLKVAFINATPRGGGVAEILGGLVPLLCDGGIRAKWYIIPPVSQYAGLMNKEFHNALQGKNFSVPERAKKEYIKDSKNLAKVLQDIKPDIWVMEDPQPAGSLMFFESKQRRPAISRIHIDTTVPNKETWEFMRSFLVEYDRIVFTSREFIGSGLPQDKVRISPVAIDPLAPKNQLMKMEEARALVESYGIDTKRPLIVQVARFDPWKDPWGAVRAYRIIKKKIPEVQFVFLGLMLAADDPDGAKIYRDIKQYSKGDPDIHLYAHPALLGNIPVHTFVSAFQTAADVILHKAIREGFGLVVTEAMWKGKIVVGGNVGGIKLQITDGVNGFLVNSTKEAAAKIIEILEDPESTKIIGENARESVRKNFLLPRLMRDYLRFFQELQ